MNAVTNIFGLVAEFKDHAVLVEAARRARAEGYRRLDAYTPFPVEGLSEALGRDHSWVPLIVLLGGICGGVGGYFMEWYSMAQDYPINVGGRPFNSWPAYIPITFELTVLAAALSALIGMLFLNRLPEPSHPLFNVNEFDRASTDRFFLCIEADDPRFDLVATRRWLESLHPESLKEVPL
jgi:hypothetical protein